MAEVGIIGAGIVGLAAADALARRGVAVEVLERAEPGSGQSAGYVRVFRHIHAEQELVRLAVEARRGWQEWQERCGQTLLGEEGVLFAGPEAAQRAADLAAAGVEHELVDEEEQRRLLPILAPPGGPALLDVHGGSTAAKAAIACLAASAAVVRAEATGLRPDGDGIAVETRDGERRYERVLVCAGVDTPHLVRPLGVEIPLEVRPHVRATYRVRPGILAAPLACWLDRTGAYGASVYSAPVAALGGYAVGLAADEPGGEEDGGERSLAALRSYVTRALPGLEPEPVDLRPCELSLLPWHSDSFAAWQAAAVTAFAGHNLFKLAPALGRLLAETVVSGEVPPELRQPA